MPRSTPPPQQRGIFHPPNDVATYRDLLLFEERLKTNAANLKRRKSRYQLFLAQLLIVIAILLSDVLLYTSFLALPLNFLLSHVWPDRPPAQLHPYFTSGLLFIAVTTLVLFYASGLYAEKIGYANRFVHHLSPRFYLFKSHHNIQVRTTREPRPPIIQLISECSLSAITIIFKSLPLFLPSNSRAPSCLSTTNRTAPAWFKSSARICHSSYSPNIKSSGRTHILFTS